MQLKLAFGPMFSGKTTWLINEHNKLPCHDNTLFINHTFEYDRNPFDYCVSHNNVQCTTKSVFSKTLTQYNIEFISTQNIKNIFVNEGQFFDDLDKWLYNMQCSDINIWVSGLDYDYKQKPFGKILLCIPLCDEYHKLTSICAVCQDVACFTKRTSHDKKKVLIGNDDKYMPVCRKCYFKNNLN
tara:strand:+ start:5566 stop:6117 length:552 start_codon:yes stop_codon:yes gene_type:complete